MPAGLTIGYTASMAKILVHTLGSSGDLNPFLALALELRRRGHQIHFALSPLFAEKARALGFDATIAGEDPQWDSDLMRRMLAAHRTDPVRIIFEEALIPAIAPAVKSLEPLAREADLFLSHTIQLAAPIVAERTGIPWISASAATMIYETAAYPPPGVAWKGSPAFLNRLGWQWGYKLFAGIDALAAAEYQKLGAAPRANIMAGGAYSRQLTLGLWSPAFFPRPNDWPDWFQVGGYARWDGTASPAPPSGAVAPLLGAGGTSSHSPTVLFTLGSSVVNDPRGFYDLALQAIAPTPWNAVLLGAPNDFPIPKALRERVQALRHAPYADLFPWMEAIVHQGGVGTTQAACYYGIPSLVVPRGFDQFENAAHIQREGWGLRLLPQDLSAYALRFRLERLLLSEEIRTRVRMLSEQMQAEPGISRSADLVEAALAGGQ